MTVTSTISQYNFNLPMDKAQFDAVVATVISQLDSYFGSESSAINVSLVFARDSKKSFIQVSAVKLNFTDRNGKTFWRKASVIGRNISARSLFRKGEAIIEIVSENNKLLDAEKRINDLLTSGISQGEIAAKAAGLQVGPNAWAFLSIDVLTFQGALTVSLKQAIAIQKILDKAL